MSLEMEQVLINLSNEPDLSLVKWQDVLQQLSHFTRYCQDAENRSALDTTNFTNCGVILETLMSLGSSHDDVFVEAYRFLRNSVVACKKNQDAVRETGRLYKLTHSFHLTACGLSTAEMKEGQPMDPSSVVKVEQIECSEDKLLAIRCSLQFLANSMVDNKQNVQAIAILFLEDLNILLSTFDSDEKVVQYVAMIIHLILKDSCTDVLVPPTIIQSLLHNLHLEFVVYAMESLVASKNFTDIYETLEPEGRIRLLNFLNARPDLVKDLGEKAIEMIKLHFVERSDFILRSKLNDRDNTFCWEIAVLLETLCFVSVSDNADALKSDKVLLTTVLYLLKQVHEAGKDTGDKDNVFSLVEDLGKLTSKSTSNTDVDDIRAHPTFQFKAHLIRLLANLAHKSSAVQNRVRELECLPIVLDSCKIDARNPFITQWAVLAIRNLCEGNEENQSYIREVQRIDTENLLPKLELVDLSND